MRISLAITVVLAVVGGCKNKEAPAGGTPPAGSPGGAAGGPGGAAGGAGGAGGTLSATASATGDLKPVNECPAALKDTDKGLSRTIPAGCTTLVEGEYYIDGVLIVEGGATLKFAADAAMYVGYSGGSKLHVRGSKDKPATFTSAGDQAAGAWRGVHLYPKAARSEISGLVLEYAQVGLDLEAPDVSVKDSTFRGTRDLAVRVHDDYAVAAFAGNTFDKIGTLAMSIGPAAMLGFGPGNQFPVDAVIELRGGGARASGTWQNPGAPLRVSGEVYIEGKPGKATVQIAAGTAFRFESGGGVYVGYAGEGELKVAGTKEAPVTFTSAGDATAGAWERGIVCYQAGAITVANAVFEHGGRDHQGALRSEGGKLSVTGSTFKNNVVGLSADDGTDLREFDQNQLSGNRDAALVAFPKHVGALGGANVYEAGQKIMVRGGPVGKTSTWRLQAGAQLVVDGEIYVEQGAALTLPAGASYVFTDAAGLYVGYTTDGTLLVQGTPEKPVTLGGARDEVGSWKGIEFYGSARASVIDNLVVKHAAGGGVRASGGAALTVNGLRCAKCAEAALRWDCGSKVIQTGVKAEDGTPKATLVPEGC